MNPAKLLASRNILLGVGVVAALFVVVVVLQTGTGSTETMPPAERFGSPPEATGEVVPLETVLAAFQRNRTNALRRYRQAPMSARVDSVQPVGKSGWASLVTLDNGRATAYFTEPLWKSIHPPVEAGQTRTFTCADWQHGGSNSVVLYGCGVVRTPEPRSSASSRGRRGAKVKVAISAVGLHHLRTLRWGLDG